MLEKNVSDLVRTVAAILPVKNCLARCHDECNPNLGFGCKLMKLHFRSMSFDLCGKKGRDSFESFNKCELLTSSSLSRKVTIEPKSKFAVSRPHSRQRLQ